jgi:hypothetical protein
MFAKWFGAPSPRRSEQANRFRPQLEYLEGRLAPSAMGAVPYNGHGNGNGNGNGGGGPPGHVNNNGNNHENIHINQHDNFNLSDNTGVGIVLNNLSVNQTVTSIGTPAIQLEQQLFSALVQAVMTTPGATIGDALSLASDEFQLGQDTGMLLQGILSTGTTNATLVTTIHNLQTAIQSNILETSAAGQLAGTLAFDVGLNASLPQL